MPCVCAVTAGRSHYNAALIISWVVGAGVGSENTQLPAAAAHAIINKPISALKGSANIGTHLCLPHDGNIHFFKP